MIYELYRVDDPDRPHLGTRLGEYPDFDTALATRDDDVIAQLTDRPATRGRSAMSSSGRADADR